MINISKQFLIDSLELISLTPEQPFTKADIETIQFLQFNSKSIGDVIVKAINAALNNDVKSLAQFSFFNQNNFEPLLSLANKINDDNLLLLIHLSTYSFDKNFYIELDDNLQPINQDNIYKMQSLALNCVENQTCSIIVPFTVNDLDVSFIFPSAQNTINKDDSTSFQYYINNTSLNNLFDITEPEPTIQLIKNKTTFLDIFQIEEQNLEAILNFLTHIENHNLYSSIPLLDFAYKINPSLINENPQQLQQSLTSYFKENVNVTINSNIQSDVENLPISSHNDIYISQIINKILTNYKSKHNSNSFFNLFFTEHVLSKSITAKLILDNNNNIEKIINETNIENPLLKILKNNHTNLKNTINKEKNNREINLPQAKLTFNHNNKNDILKYNYLQNFIDTFNPAQHKLSQLNYPLTLLYPYLKDEHREDLGVIKSILIYIQQSSTKYNTIENSLYIDNFFHHIPLNAFKKNYLNIYQNLLQFPNFDLACYFELENSMKDVIEFDENSYNPRPFQDHPNWRKFCENNSLKSILENISQFETNNPGSFPICSKLIEKDDPKYFAFFFKKFALFFNPLKSRLFGHNSLHNLFGIHFIENYESDVHSLININKTNVFDYLKSFQYLHQTIQDKIVENISNIDWDCNNQQDIDIFPQFLQKIGKKKVLLISENPKTHKMFKQPDIFKSLIGTAYFTNSVPTNSQLPMQHIFSLKDIEILYEQNPNKEFIKISPFTFIPMAPAKYKTDPKLWTDLMTEKSKTSILQFMPLSLKNNHHILLNMITNAPSKTESILSHFSQNAKTNIAVFLQCLKNVEYNKIQVSAITRTYSFFLDLINPNSDEKNFDVKAMQTLCEELLLNKITPKNIPTKKNKTIKF